MAWKRASFYRFFCSRPAPRDSRLVTRGGAASAATNYRVYVSDGYVTNVDGYDVGVSKDSRTMATDILTGRGISINAEASNIDDLKAAVESSEFIARFSQCNRESRENAESEEQRDTYVSLLAIFKETVAAYEDKNGGLEQFTRKRRTRKTSADSESQDDAVCEDKIHGG